MTATSVTCEFLSSVQIYKSIVNACHRYDVNGYFKNNTHRQRDLKGLFYQGTEDDLPCARLGHRTESSVEYPRWLRVFQYFMN